MQDKSTRRKLSASQYAVGEFIRRNMRIQRLERGGDAGNIGDTEKVSTTSGLFSTTLRPFSPTSGPVSPTSQ